MRNFVMLSVLAGAVAVTGAACATNPSEDRARTTKTQPSTSEPKPRQAAQPEIRTSAPTDRAERIAITATDNPTTRAGRGEPSLSDIERPAAWIFIDGQEGRYTERDGHRQLQWVIDRPVSNSPTFQVEVFEPLLGTPRDVKYLIKSAEAEGLDIAYAVSAYDGQFVPGRQYKLLVPGEGFLIRNWHSGDVVREIGPLPPGTYLIAATVSNRETGKETAAVTYFTVADGAEE